MNEGWLWLSHSGDIKRDFQLLNFDFRPPKCWASLLPSVFLQLPPQE